MLFFHPEVRAIYSEKAQDSDIFGDKFGMLGAGPNLPPYETRV